MPTSKHRRKGKLRPRGAMNSIPVILNIKPSGPIEEDPEDLENDRLVRERLREYLRRGPPVVPTTSGMKPRINSSPKAKFDPDSRTMLTVVLTDEERVLLLDALEAFLEMTPICPDPNAPMAERLMARLRDKGENTDQPRR